MAIAALTTALLLKSPTWAQLMLHRPSCLTASLPRRCLPSPPLLLQVVGTSGNIVLDGGSDDEGAAEEHYGEAIIAALGMERRNQVLSRLYVCR